MFFNFVVKYGPDILDMFLKLSFIFTICAVFTSFGKCADFSSFWVIIEVKLQWWCFDERAVTLSLSLSVSPSRKIKGVDPAGNEKVNLSPRWKPEWKSPLEQQLFHEKMILVSAAAAAFISSDFSICRACAHLKNIHLTPC